MKHQLQADQTAGDTTGTDQFPEVRICMIDDDEQLVSTITRLLAARGYRSLGITTTIGSSNVVRQFNPHLILLDAMMPALEGSTLLELYRRNLPRLPRTILFSGMPPAELEQLALEIGVDDYIYKGDGIFSLLGRINLHVYEMTKCGKL